MQSRTMTTKTSSGCGCGGGAAKSAKPCGCGSSSAPGYSAGCGCGGKGCSTCNAGPEVYTRPLFFSGQLLTEDDLQSLTEYVTGKNRLRNRMLFGAGVACGLRVSVDDCEPKRHLLVRPGYAIDCCGNDIVVPCETRLDVVQLVRDLRLRSLGKDCGDPCPELGDEPTPTPAPPPAPAPPGNVRVEGGGEAVEAAAPLPAADAVLGTASRDRVPMYCLYLVYCEQPAEPVAPYDGEENCGGGDCRFTRVREGYRFELRCGTPTNCATKTPVKPKTSAFGTNTEKAAYIYGQIAQANAAWDARTREEAVRAIENGFGQMGVYQHPDAMKLVAEARGLGDAARDRTRFNTIALVLLAGMLRQLDCDDMIQDCASCDEDGVLIACFDFKDCTLGNVCNFRRMPILSPAYFSQLGFTNVWRCLMEYICCGRAKYTDPGAGRLDDIRMGGVGRAAALRAERAAAGEVIEGVIEVEGNANNNGNGVARDPLRELEAFIKSRIERIDDPEAPEFRFTMLPEIARGFSDSVMREKQEAEVQVGELRDEISVLRGELAQLRDYVGSIKVKGARRGDNQ